MVVIVAAGALVALRTLGFEGPSRLLLRPEQLEVRVINGSSDTGAGGVEGRIELCRYYGHDALLHIRLDELDGGKTLLARVQGEQALPAGTAVLLAAHGPVTIVE